MSGCLSYLSSCFTWKKEYTVIDNPQGEAATVRKIPLNWFERAARKVFGAYQETHLANAAGSAQFCLTNSKRMWNNLERTRINELLRRADKANKLLSMTIGSIRVTNQLPTNYEHITYECLARPYLATLTVKYKNGAQGMLQTGIDIRVNSSKPKVLEASFTDHSISLAEEEHFLTKHTYAYLAKILQSTSLADRIEMVGNRILEEDMISRKFGFKGGKRLNSDETPLMLSREHAESYAKGCKLIQHNFSLDYLLNTPTE